MTLTVGSLFSGIGGLDLGLERAGMTVAWQSEIESGQLVPRAIPGDLPPTEHLHGERIKLSVECSMAGSGDDDEVLCSIVGLVAVDVVHHLSRGEAPSDLFLCDEHMLADVGLAAPSGADQDVPLPIHRPAPPPGGMAFPGSLALAFIGRPPCDPKVVLDRLVGDSQLGGNRPLGHALISHGDDLIATSHGRSLAEVLP